jgi:hypothetical protein
LPFNFCFYGTEYNSLYINNKGNITFGVPAYDFSTTGFPLGLDTVMVAPFFADISDTPPYSSSISFAYIFYKITPTHMVVQWNTVGYETFDDDLFDNFQLIITNGSDSILTPGNNVSFCYDLMQWASGDSSGGSAGFGGKPAIAGVNKGDGIHYAKIGTFDLPGYGYIDPFDTNSGVYWLNSKSATFNTCVTGDIIPPVIINPDSCNKFTVCAGDTIVFNAFFVCPQPGQRATLSVGDSGLTGTIPVYGRIDSIYRIACRLIASIHATGTHVIKLTATDNSTPPLSNSRVITVTIDDCAGLGINDLNNGSSPLTLYPNPNDGCFTLENGKLTGERGPIKLEIYNVLGEKIYTQPFILHFPVILNLSNEPSGIYFYRAIEENGNLLGDGKFVIQ